MMCDPVEHDTDELAEIHVGQLWTVHDSHQRSRRWMRIEAAETDVNDPDVYGAKVIAINIANGRRSYLQASTVRDYWRLEGTDD